MSFLYQKKCHKIAILFSTLLFTLACGKQEQAGPKAPAPAVTTYVIESDNIGQYSEFVARTAASSRTVAPRGEVPARRPAGKHLRPRKRARGGVA